MCRKNMITLCLAGMKIILSITISYVKQHELNFLQGTRHFQSWYSLCTTNTLADISVKGIFNILMFKFFV